MVWMTSNCQPIKWQYFPMSRVLAESKQLSKNKFTLFPSRGNKEYPPTKKNEICKIDCVYFFSYLMNKNCQSLLKFKKIFFCFYLFANSVNVSYVSNFILKKWLSPASEVQNFQLLLGIYIYFLLRTQIDLINYYSHHKNRKKTKTE